MWQLTDKAKQEKNQSFKNNFAWLGDGRLFTQIISVKMGDITFETAAYAKIILHAAKYPHCAVNGVLLADANRIRDGAKNQDLSIVDSIPLFHHSHYLSPMAEIALTQVNFIS